MLQCCALDFSHKTRPVTVLCYGFSQDSPTRVEHTIDVFYLNPFKDDFSFVNPVCPEDYFTESDGLKVYLNGGYPSSQEIFDLTCPAKFSK